MRLTIFAIHNLTNASTTRLIKHLRDPLYRNGYALVLNGMMTSALGMLYWILAARNYATETVGLNSAAIAAMLFLANVSQLNLKSVLNRFIPTAGGRTGPLIIHSYLVSIVAAVMASTIFVVGVGVWAPSLNALKSDQFFALGFTFATTVWCIFVLQDSVLAGLRRATWVPVENVIFAVAKIGLLIVMAGLSQQYGIFASWAIPVAVAIIVVNILIFRQLIPQHIVATESQVVPIIPLQILKFVAGDYLGSLFSLASTMLLPVIVINQVGASANAYFYLVWTIATSLYLVSSNMVVSLTVEGASDETNLCAYGYSTLIHMARLLVPLVLITLIGAPKILTIFGKDYATEGTMLLRLLALAAIPRSIITLYLGLARVRRKIVEMVSVQGLSSALVLSLSIVLLERNGIVGVGIAWLTSQTIIATILTLTQLRPILCPVVTSAEIVSQTQCPHDLVPLDQPGATSTTFSNVANWPRLLPHLGSLWHRWRDRRDMTRAHELFPAILATIPSRSDVPPPLGWIVQRIEWRNTRGVVIMLGPPEQQPTAVLKLSRQREGAAGLEPKRSVLAALGTHTRLNEWCAILPQQLSAGEIADFSYVIESALPGSDGRTLISDPAALARVQITAAIAIGQLHQLTASPVKVDAALCERWIDQPLLYIRRLNATLPRMARNDAAIDRLAVELHEALAGRTLLASWIHGDFWLGNILVAPDGAKLTGMVDWEYAAPDELPAHDLLFLLLSTRGMVQHHFLGEVVRSLLSESKWMPHERTLLKAVEMSQPDDTVGLRAMVLLCWLRHTAANLARYPGYQSRPWWTAKNVMGVLRCV